MKILVLALAILIPSGSAFAWPSVGDTWVHDVDYDYGGERERGEFVYTILEIDTAADKVLISESYNTSRGRGGLQYSRKLSAMKEKARQVRENVKYCIFHGGIPENIRTPAGTFSTCKVRRDTLQIIHYTWVADVPGGWVKSVKKTRTPGQTGVEILRSFKVGH